MPQTAMQNENVWNVNFKITISFLFLTRNTEENNSSEF